MNIEYKHKNGFIPFYKRIANKSVTVIYDINTKPYAETIFVFRLTNLHNFEENALETNYGIMYAQMDPINRGKPKYQAIAIYKWFYGKDADLTPLYWYYNKVTQGEN